MGGCGFNTGEDSEGPIWGFLTIRFGVTSNPPTQIIKDLPAALYLSIGQKTWDFSPNNSEKRSQQMKDAHVCTPVCMLCQTLCEQIC